VAKTFQDTLNGVVRLCQDEYERLANNLQANDHKAKEIAKCFATQSFFFCIFTSTRAVRA
jgi:hypothetical protein